MGLVAPNPRSRLKASRAFLWCPTKREKDGLQQCGPSALPQPAACSVHLGEDRGRTELLLRMHEEMHPTWHDDHRSVQEGVRRGMQDLLGNPRKDWPSVKNWQLGGTDRFTVLSI